MLQLVLLEDGLTVGRNMSEPHVKCISACCWFVNNHVWGRWLNIVYMYVYISTCLPCLVFFSDGTALEVEGIMFMWHSISSQKSCFYFTMFLVLNSNINFCKVLINRDVSIPLFHHVPTHKVRLGPFLSASNKTAVKDFGSWV
jgi:hypothetical protein